MLVFHVAQQLWDLLLLELMLELLLLELMLELALGRMSLSLHQVLRPRALVDTSPNDPSFRASL